MPFPQREVRPGLHARVRRRDGELRLRHVVRLLPAPVHADPPRRRASSRCPAARDGAHVVRQHRDDALVGRPLAQRGVRGVRLQLGRGAAPPRITDAWAGSLASDKLTAYLADQGADLAPHQPADRRRRRGSVDLRLHHLSQGRLGAAPADDYVGEDDVRGRHDGVLRPHAWGNTTLQDLVDELAAASGRDLDAWRAAWLETAGTDRLTLEREGDGFVLVARGPTRGRRGRRCWRRRLPARRDAGLERTPPPGRGPGRAHAGGAAAEADLYLVNDDDLTFATVRPDADAARHPVADAGLLPTPDLARGRGRHGVGHAGHRRRPAAEAVRCLTGVLRARPPAPSSSPISSWPATPPSCGPPTVSARSSRRGRGRVPGDGGGPGPPPGGVAGAGPGGPLINPYNLILCLFTH